MNRNICHFVPQTANADIETFRFVYETEFLKCKQPITCATYCAYLVTAGSAILKMQSQEYTITKNTLFFTFPSVPFEILGHHDLEYIYISFSGTDIQIFLKKLGVNLSQFVFYNLENVTELWTTSIQRIDKYNISILTECALLYALSFIKTASNQISDRINEKPFSRILIYINNNFTDSDFSIKKVAVAFSYNDKYLSHLFKRNTGITFTNYLNKIRIQHAQFLIENGMKSVSQVSAACGFSDPQYFSKVFRNHEQLSPKERIKEFASWNK